MDEEPAWVFEQEFLWLCIPLAAFTTKIFLEDSFQGRKFFFLCALNPASFQVKIREKNAKFPTKDWVATMMGSKRIQFSSFPFITKVVGKKESTLLGHVYAITTTKSLIYPFPATQFNKKNRISSCKSKFSRQKLDVQVKRANVFIFGGKIRICVYFSNFSNYHFSNFEFSRQKSQFFFLFFKFPHLNLNFRAKIIRKKFWMKRQKFLFLVLAQKFKLFSKLQEPHFF